MDKELREKIRQATEASDVRKSDFIDLLRLIDQHYDKMEATITQSLTITTPIEVVFDSVTEALMSVSASGEVRVCEAAQILENNLGKFSCFFVVRTEKTGTYENGKCNHRSQMRILNQLLQFHVI